MGIAFALMPQFKPSVKHINMAESIEVTAIKIEPCTSINYR